MKTAQVWLIKCVDTVARLAFRNRGGRDQGRLDLSLSRRAHRDTEQDGRRRCGRPGHRRLGRRLQEGAQASKGTLKSTATRSVSSLRCAHRDPRPAARGHRQAITGRRLTSSRLRPFGLTRRSKLLGFGGDGAARLRHSCHESAVRDRLSRAMLESVCEHPLPRRHLNETDLSLSEQQKLTTLNIT